MNRVIIRLAIFALVLGGTMFNFAVLLAAYNKLAFPYLHETQRMGNAPFLFYYALPAFLLISILFAGAAYTLGRFKAEKQLIRHQTQNKQALADGGASRLEW